MDTYTKRFEFFCVEFIELDEELFLCVHNYLHDMCHSLQRQKFHIQFCYTCKIKENYRYVHLYILFVITGVISLPVHKYLYRLISNNHIK